MGQTGRGSGEREKHTAVNLGQVGQEGEDTLVAKRNKDDTVMGQSRERGVDGHLLSSTRTGGGNKDTSVLSSESTRSPEATSSIPECLSRIHVSVSVILSDRHGVITFH